MHLAATRRTTTTVGQPTADVVTETVTKTGQNGTGGKLRSRGGANHVTHGLRGLGWPRGAGQDRRRVAEFTRALTAAHVDSGGVLGIVEAGLIQTAARWERHARLCGRWLREGEGLTVEQRLAPSRDVGKASESRDRAIAALGPEAARSAEPLGRLL